MTTVTVDLRSHSSNEDLHRVASEAVNTAMNDGTSRLNFIALQGGPGATGAMMGAIGAHPAVTLFGNGYVSQIREMPKLETYVKNSPRATTDPERFFDLLTESREASRSIIAFWDSNAGDANPGPLTEGSTFDTLASRAENLGAALVVTMTYRWE